MLGLGKVLQVAELTKYLMDVRVSYLSHLSRMQCILINPLNDPVSDMNRSASELTRRIMPGRSIIISVICFGNAA